jgi:hypothetical protein
MTKPEADIEALAAAWDLGWCAGVSRFTQRTEPPKDNPYRADCTTNGGCVRDTAGECAATPCNAREDGQ